MGSEAIDLILVGLDESNAARKAFTFALAIAERYDADIYALEVRPEETVDAISRGELDPAVAARRSEAILDEVAAEGAAAGVTIRTGTAIGYSKTRKLTHPGSVVLDIAESIEASMIVLPREREPVAEWGTLGKAAQYALQYATQPVIAV